LHALLQARDLFREHVSDLIQMVTSNFSDGDFTIATFGKCVKEIYGVTLPDKPPELTSDELVMRFLEVWIKESSHWRSRPDGPQASWKEQWENSAELLVEVLGVPEGMSPTHAQVKRQILIFEAIANGCIRAHLSDDDIYYVFQAFLDNGLLSEATLFRWCAEAPDKGAATEDVKRVALIVRRLAQEDDDSPSP